MTSLALMADDLTGALDSAAPFSVVAPVQVAWSDDAFIPGQRMRALDGNSRDIATHLAQERVYQWLARSISADISFKKLDSLLRGNTIAELEICCRCDRYATVVVAPAFPAQNRITTNGVQQMREHSQAAWQQIGPSLLTALPGAQAVAAGQVRGGRGVFVCDAYSQDDLDLIAQCKAWAQPVLWCGTSGLARALSGPSAAITPGSFGQMLIVLGSHHDMTRAQLMELEREWPGTQVQGVGNDPATTARRLAGTLATKSLAHLWMTEPMAQSAAADWFNAMFGVLIELCRPDAVVCGGGETSRRFCAAARVGSLMVEGEWQPGFPVSLIHDGPWATTHLFTKAGAFGSAHTLAALVNAVSRSARQ